MIKIKYFLLILLIVITQVFAQEKIAVIDSFGPIPIIKREDGEVEVYKLYHGLEVINIIQAIHPEAEIMKFDAVEETLRRMDDLDYPNRTIFINIFQNVMADYIIQATDEGADVVNISLAVFYKTQKLENAIKYAWENGTIVVFSAGNEDPVVPDRKKIWFPEALIVGATDYQGDITDWSYTGDIYTWGLSVDANALRIWRAYLGSLLEEDVFYQALEEQFKLAEMTRYAFPIQFLSGTSFSAPIIAGLVAEVMKYMVFEQPEEIVDYLLSFTQPDDKGNLILTIPDLVPLYQDFGFDVGEPEITFTPEEPDFGPLPELPVSSAFRRIRTLPANIFRRFYNRFGTIDLTYERWEHIQEKHPEVKINKIREVIESYDLIEIDGVKKIYKKLIDDKELLVVTKQASNSNEFILTSYYKGVDEEFIQTQVIATAFIGTLRLDFPDEDIMSFEDRLLFVDLLLFFNYYDVYNLDFENFEQEFRFWWSVGVHRPNKVLAVIELLASGDQFGALDLFEYGKFFRQWVKKEPIYTASVDVMLGIYETLEYHFEAFWSLFEKFRR